MYKVMISVVWYYFRVGKLEVVKYLVENYNVKINATSKAGKTPMDFAQE